MLKYASSHFKRFSYLLLKAFLGFLCISLLIFSVLQATEERLALEDSQHSSRSYMSHLVSPKAVEIQEKLNFFHARYPEISQSDPIINCKDDFQLAKHYLIVSKAYAETLLEIAKGFTHLEILNQMHQICKDNVTYLEILRSPVYSHYRSEAEDRELEESFYESNFRLSMNYLTFLARLDFHQENNLNLQTAQGYVKEIKSIKRILANSPNYRHMLQRQIEDMQAIKPHFILLFDPARKLQPSQQPSKTSRKIQQLRNLKYDQRLTNAINSFQDSSYRENFDCYFPSTIHEIFTQENQLGLKSMAYSQYSLALQRLIDNYFHLEEDGLKFRAQMLQLEPLNQTEPLNSDQLNSLYKFFYQRYSHIPQKSPITFLPRIINMLIYANKLNAALIRTAILEELLLKQGALPDAFIYFRAGVLALNGKPEEWVEILKREAEAHNQRKMEAHIKRLTRIKKNLRAKQQEEKSIKGVEMLSTKVKPQEKKVKAVASSNLPTFEQSSNPQVNYKSELVFPREKMKTRKPSQVSLIETSQIVPQSPSTKEPLSKGYFISKNAFKTYRKIRTGDWKFSRKELYNLFAKLGCTIDISQGKGSHSKIVVPLSMTIEKEGRLIAALPEFTTAEVSTLIIPDWDNKWDGRVPPYLTKSIIAALDTLQAIDETVHKGNLKE